MALGDLPVRRYFGPLFAIGGHGGQDLFVVTLSAGLEVGVVWIEKLPGGDDALLSQKSSKELVKPMLSFLRTPSLQLSK